MREFFNLSEEGNPQGGFTHLSGGNRIDWQSGPIPNGIQNGALIEDVLRAAIGRLTFFQTFADGKFACDENASAIEHCQEAIRTLESRTAARVARGVEGT